MPKTLLTRLNVEAADTAPKAFVRKKPEGALPTVKLLWTPFDNPSPDTEKTVEEAEVRLVCEEKVDDALEMKIHLRMPEAEPKCGRAKEAGPCGETGAVH